MNNSDYKELQMQEEISEETRILMEKDQKIKDSEPYSAERAELLIETVNYHQENLINKIKEIEIELNSRKAEFIKMEGSKELLRTFIEK
tara:strand:+ start:320 stop:586 length:267 start_codon:yes stop_codon:yes gene_type:complete